AGETGSYADSVFLVGGAICTDFSVARLRATFDSSLTISLSRGDVCHKVWIQRKPGRVLPTKRLKKVWTLQKLVRANNTRWTILRCKWRSAHRIVSTRMKRRLR